MSAALSSALARIRPDVQSMHAYAVQDATGMVKLDAMENPFTLAPDMQAALGMRLGAVAINRYPGARVNDLKDTLARSVDLPLGCSLMLGNGSDELIALLALACDRPGASVLAPEPGFVMYAMSAQLQGLSYHSVPLTEDFELDEPAMLAAIAQHRPAITYLAYPNNPTANLWSAPVLRRLIAAVADIGGLVVMDEAYQPFSSATWLDEIRAQPEANAHVLLMRTLSKFGLAGVRLGYMLGATPLIAEIDKVRPPYNVSVLNTECALFALQHTSAFAEQAAEIRAQRGVLLAGLVQLKGVRAFKSEANMVLVRWPARDAHDDGAATRVFEQLKAAGILVKNVSKMHPLLRNCLRLTVGTPSENQRLLNALQHCL
ncbi:MAG: Histidinol-phosphate aminotransferase 2 [Pseudomonadota bacterium]|jgi:histidinol-phosphate aminotransferase